MGSSIDSIISQTYFNADPITCNKCMCQTKGLVRMSCSHYLCIDCGIELSNNSSAKCSICNYSIDIIKLSPMLLNTPIKKLFHYFNIKIGDIIWIYGDSCRKWIFSKTKCELLNFYYNLFNTSQKSANFEIETSGKNYQINFNNNTLYLKEKQNIIADICSFILKSYHDLKKYKIIGVEGKLL